MKTNLLVFLALIATSTTEAIQQKGILDRATYLVTHQDEYNKEKEEKKKQQDKIESEKLKKSVKAKMKAKLDQMMKDEKEKKIQEKNDIE